MPQGFSTSLLPKHASICKSLCAILDLSTSFFNFFGHIPLLVASSLTLGSETTVVNLWLTYCQLTPNPYHVLDTKISVKIIWSLFYITVVSAYFVWAFEFLTSSDETLSLACIVHPLNFGRVVKITGYKFLTTRNLSSCSRNWNSHKETTQGV
jgi:hypothetical protein